MCKRPKPDTGLTRRNSRCPKADDIVCSCGETLEPHSFIKTFFGRFKYYYTCSECGEKHKTYK